MYNYLFSSESRSCHCSWCAMFSIHYSIALMYNKENNH